MAEKLCRQFGAGPHTLKIGKSFENNKGGSKYHSIRYDFKPNSIDEERMGSLEVKERQGVSVQLPHSDGVGQTLYKGNAETAPTKDCVLIIDHETGELTLERISNKIMVKKTRQEKLEKAGAGGHEVNPYEVKVPEAAKPYNEVKVPEAANPYAVKPPENANPYAVKPPEASSNPYAVKAPEGAKPYVARPPKTTKQAKQQRSSNSSARPHTPQQPQDKYQPPPVNPLKKRSPVHPELAPCLSPHHSNKSSPASTSGRGPSGQGYNFDSLGRPLSSSDSSSDSGSDSEAEDPPSPNKAAPAPPKVALPPPKTSKAADSLDCSGLGTLDDLLGAGPPPAPTRPGGTVATARPPSSKHSNNTSRTSSKTSSRAPAPPPSMPGSFSDPDDPDDPPPSSMPPYMAPSMPPSMPPFMAPSMPPSMPPSMAPAPPPSMPSVFDALGDDLELSDDSD